MFTTRFKDVKAACGKAVGMCATDVRVKDYVNRATERLLDDGKWKGTVQTFRLCVDSANCIVWPREMLTIEAISTCSSPLPIESEWYEFNEHGPGQVGDTSCLAGMIDRGEVCSFDQVAGTNKKLAVFCDRAEGTGKYINLQFYDQYGQWVTSTFNGEVIDGEQIAIPSTAGTYNYTTNVCKPGGLMRVKKDLTLGVVRLYEYNTVTGALKPLAYYQADEEVPVYRKSYIPGLSDSACAQKQVTARAKLRFIPVLTDESFVMISSREALRCACKALLKEENDIHDDAAVNWGIAYRILNAQLRSYKGDGEVPRIKVQSRRTFGGAGKVLV